MYVTFHSEDDIIHFVEVCNNYDDAIDILAGKSAMDAKSILGMLKMKIEHPLEIDYGCYDDEDNYGEFKAEIQELFDCRTVPANRSAMEQE